MDSARACALDDEAVLRRWTPLFAGPLLVQRYRSEARSQMGDTELYRQHTAVAQPAQAMNAVAFIACADHFFKDFAGAVGTPAKLIEISTPRQ